MIKSRRELCGVTTLAVLLAGAVPGCNNKDRSVPAGPPGLPPVSATAGEGQVHAPTMAQMGMPSDHPQSLHGRSEGDVPAAATGGVISGSLNLADNVKAKVPAGGTIFLIARALSPTGGPGPVLAAKRLTVGAWPQQFELSANDVMITGTSLSGKVVLGARVDQDGDAMTKQVGDVEGISTPVDVPATGVVVLLDKLRTETAGAPSPPNMGGMGGGMPAGHPPTELPAGHPSVGQGADPSAPAAAAATAPAMPAGHPAMPAGHPPTGHPPVGRPPAAKATKPAGHP